MKSIVSILACLVCGFSGITGAQSTPPRPHPSNPQPDFPAKAAGDAVIGRVEVRLNVGRDGAVDKIQVLQAVPRDYGFKEATEEALHKWRFDPATENGTAVGGTYEKVFDFKLRNPVPLSRWDLQGKSPVTVGNGDLLTVRAADGWVRTVRWYSDFQLDFEFRVVEPKTAAALLVRAASGERKARSAYRINLTDAIDGPFALGRVTSASLAAPPFEMTEFLFDQRQLASVVKPQGEWQNMRIVCENSSVRVLVNGVLVSSADVQERTGHIGLEGDGGRLEIRAVRVQRLDSYMSPLPPPGKDLPYITMPQAGVTGPKMLDIRTKPNYADYPTQKRIEGTALLEGIVLPDGTLGPIHLKKSLDLDLDQSAVAAIRRWRFTPAVRNGAAVPCRIEFEMSFTLK